TAEALDGQFAGRRVAVRRRPTETENLGGPGHCEEGRQLVGGVRAQFGSSLASAGSPGDRTARTDRTSAGQGLCPLRRFCHALLGTGSRACTVALGRFTSGCTR